MERCLENPSRWECGSPRPLRSPEAACAQTPPVPRQTRRCGSSRFGTAEGDESPATGRGAGSCGSRRLPELPPAGEPTARQLPLEPRLGPRLAFGETEAPGGWDCPRRGAGRGLVCRWDFDEPVVRVVFTPCWDAQLSQQRMAVGGPVSGGGSPLLGAGSARARCVPARSPGSTGHTGGGVVVVGVVPSAKRRRQSIHLSGRHMLP